MKHILFLIALILIFTALDIKAKRWKPAEAWIPPLFGFVLWAVIEIIGWVLYLLYCGVMSL